MGMHVVIGGGLAGLLAGRALAERNIPFLGVEKDDCLGGRLQYGHHRIYESETQKLLSSLCPEIIWDEIPDRPVERRRGSWSHLTSKVTEAESFYLRGGYFHPQSTYTEITHKLSLPIADKFLLRRPVSKIIEAERLIVFHDGTSLNYDRVYWCSDLGTLKRIWKGKIPSDSFLRGSVGPFFGGVSLDFTTDRSGSQFNNTFLFPFRFKDNIAHCLGTPPCWPPNHKGLHCLLFLEEDLLENKEELAKCVRALKRELFREFPELKSSITGERLVYLSSAACETPIAVPSFEILPNVVYLGPQMQLKNSHRDQLRNLDLTFHNLSHFLEAILSST